MSDIITCIQELYKGKNALQEICNNLKKTVENSENIKVNINSVINILERNKVL